LTVENAGTLRAAIQQAVSFDLLCSSIARDAETTCEKSIRSPTAADHRFAFTFAKSLKLRRHFIQRSASGRTGEEIC
jgi:hypothetical protein